MRAPETIGEREVVAFASASAHEMKRERKLALRASKGGWESPEMPLAALSEEPSGLRGALYADGGYPDVDAIRAEAADCANYLMFIRDVVGGLE